MSSLLHDSRRVWVDEGLDGAEQALCPLEESWNIVPVLVAWPTLLAVRRELHWFLNCIKPLQARQARYHYHNVTLNKICSVPYLWIYCSCSLDRPSITPNCLTKGFSLEKSPNTNGVSLDWECWPGQWRKHETSPTVLTVAFCGEIDIFPDHHPSMPMTGRVDTMHGASPMG